MEIEIKDLEKKDYNKARKYAIKGMNLSRYTENKIELYFYSKYFLYLELLRATQLLGAYMESELVGVLLADINGKPKKVKSIWYNIYVAFVKTIMNIGYKASADVYDRINDEMLKRFKNNNNPDGELIFFAVNPKITGKGIGTLLLDEFENREKGKHIYLYTDSACTYQFYDKRGFTREEEQEIEINIHNKEKKLTCFMYSKKL